MFKSIHNFFSFGASASAEFPLTQLDAPNPTPANSPRTSTGFSRDELCPTGESFASEVDLNALFRSAFRVSGEAKEKQTETLEKAVFPILSRKKGVVKEKVFWIHRETFDPDSQDATTRPAIQIVNQRIKLDQNQKPKLYVVLTPKNPDLKLSQFLPKNLSILAESSRLGLSPKMLPIIESSQKCTDLGAPIHRERQNILLLEFINGGDLLNFRYDHLILEDREKIDLMIQAITLITKLHERKIAHRDVKPENFLVRIRNERSYELLIADFGFSTKNEELTRQQCYSPGYMDPQFLQSYYLGTHFFMESEEPLSAQPPSEEEPFDPFMQDCWGLGATLFFILFGEGYEKTVRKNSTKKMPLKTLNDFIEAKQKISDQILKSMCSIFPPQVFNTLSGLLQHRPEKRLSAIGALRLIEELKTPPQPDK
jgi:serine/threonine protein kinase